jgi:hypothetical protein
MDPADIYLHERNWGLWHQCGLAHMSERRKSVDDHTHPFVSGFAFDVHDICSATHEIQSAGL